MFRLYQAYPLTYVKYINTMVGPNSIDTYRFFEQPGFSENNMYFLSLMNSTGVYTTSDAFYLTDTVIENTECFSCYQPAFDISS